MASLNSAIESRLIEAGASLVGFADISNLPADVRNSMNFAIAIAVALDASVINEIRNGPTKRYFDEYNRANKLLSQLARSTAEYLTQKGYKAMVIEPTLRQLPASLATTLPHKTVATRAGLGWVGRSNLLVTEKYGSAIRLASVVTDAPFKVSEPMEDLRCEDCNKCVIACPARALLGNNWRPGLERDKIVDVFVCRDMVVQLCKEIGLEATICGVCINVCPWTQEYLRRKR